MAYMEKRRLHFVWRKYRLISLIGLILLWVGVGLGCVYALRQNNLEMLRRREAVFVADQTGKGLEEALKSLQTYVTTHMHTTLPKLGNEKAIQLKYTYTRLVAAEEVRVTAERVRITNEATAYCESALPTVRLTERAKCVQDYIQARPVGATPIAKERYTYDFYTPMWSSDVAGWLIVFFITTSILLACRIALGVMVRRSLSSYH